MYSRMLRKFWFILVDFESKAKHSEKALKGKHREDRQKLMQCSH